jgi:thiosulfate reductase cytochrome b subunit
MDAQNRAVADKADSKGELIYRHTLPVRITHWTNVVCLIILLMSGLQIFNAHTRLYFGDRSDPEHAVLVMRAVRKDDGTPVGLTTIGNVTFNTTGVLGLSRGIGDELEARGFPRWLTLPSYRDLATGRRWHFFFAWLFVLNGLAYLAYAILSGHLRRDLFPTRIQLRNIGHDILEHLRLRFPKGEEARHYSVLQKLAYLAVILILLPLVVLSGLTMSPGLNAAFPFMLDFFGGRQSARTIHFLCAAGIVLFVIVHIVMVLVSGLWNNIRSMITGRYRIEPAE